MHVIGMYQSYYRAIRLQLMLEDAPPFYEGVLQISLIALAAVSSLISLALPCLYYLKGQCREHPAGLIANISLFEALSNYNIILIVANVYQVEQSLQINRIFDLLTFNGSNEPSLDDFCWVNLFVYMVFELLSIAYYICFSFDLFLTLKFPFFAGQKRMKFYHIFALLFVSVSCAMSLGEAEDICQKEYHQRSIFKTPLSFMVSLVLFALISVVIIIASFCVSQSASPIRLKLILLVFVLSWTCPIWANILILTGDESSKMFQVLNLISFVMVLAVSGLINIIRFCFDPYLFQCIKNMVLFRRQRRNEAQSKTQSKISSDVWNLPLADAVNQFQHQQVVQNILEVILEACSDVKLSQPVEPIPDKKLRTHYAVSMRRSTVVADLSQADNGLLGSLINPTGSVSAYPKPEECSERQIKNLCSRKRKFNMVCEGEHKSIEIVVTSYAHRIFESIRRMDHISVQKLQQSLDLLQNTESIQNAKESLGASGSFFFFSHDHRLVVKTIPEEERDTFVRVLPYYYQHIRDNPTTLIAKTYGLFSMEIAGVSKIYFMLMENAFETFEHCNLTYRKYDLKGSTVSREVKEAVRAGVLKDINYYNSGECFLMMSEDRRDKLLTQIDQDITMLKRHNIMDYSLLLGVGNCEPTMKKPNVTPSWRYIDDHNEFTNRLYCISIIDYLQEFNFGKYSEFMFKKIFKGGGNISSVDTQAYYKRFIECMKCIILSIKIPFRT